MRPFHQAHLAFLKLLETHAVQYLVVGGIAVQFHGLERETADLDVWVSKDIKNIGNLKAASVEYGYSDLEQIERLADDPGLVLPIGQPDAPVELMTHLAGVTFASCYPRRSTVKVKGIQINFISRNDLITYKHAYGRPKDLADAERLAA
jgi:hypothetical protein